MGHLSENTIFYGSMLFFWLEYAWCMYLSWRQHKLARCTTDIPDALKNLIDKISYDRSRLYFIDLLEFKMVVKTYHTLLAVMGLYIGILARIWEFSVGLRVFSNEIILNCFWMSIILTIQFFSELIPSLYRSFVIEAKHGQLTQTLKLYAIDHMKTFLFYQLFFLPISTIIVLIVQYCGDNFALWLWIAEDIFGFIAIKIYPAFIAPLFDEYTRLPKGELRTKTEKLVADIKFPITEFYIVQRKQRIIHSAEHFYGAFNTKRIVIYQHLLESSEISNDTIVAALAHEMGHWHYGHPIKSQMVVQLHMLILFILFSKISKSPLIYKFAGFKSGIQPILPGFTITVNYLAMPYSIMFGFLQNVLLRQFEFQADAFVTKLGKGDDLKRALLETHKYNLTFPVEDKFYTMWYQDHPGLLERLAAIDERKVS